VADDELERLLAQRDEIDRMVASRQQDAAILFTDIVGSTELFEKRGDVEGLAFIHRHNRLLFPVVEAHDGRVVKTIGDAIMASFEDPAQAVRCAAALQTRLAEVRANEPDETPIHIRVGVHAGKVMRDGDDVFGDAVNTAARVQGKAGKDEVLLSASLYESVAAAVALTARPGGALPLKGKAEPLPVVRLVWGPAAPDGPPREKPAAARPTTGAGLPELFVLEIAQGKGGLKVAALDGQDDKGPVKSYAEVPLPAEDLDAVASRMAAFLAGSAGSYAERLVESGEELFTRALSRRARQRLLETERTHVRLQVDDALAHVPWELLHDGHEHLCLRFATGRVVSAREDGTGRHSAPGRREGGHAVVVSNPTGDLPESAREGDAVAGLLGEGYGGEVRHLKGPVDRQAFLDALEGARLLHFAGHVSRGGEDGPAGFRLRDGVVTPEEAAARLGTTATDLVFANACHANDASGWTDAARGTFDLASTLLLRGVRHYIGPIGAIDDKDARSFALRFYEETLRGESFGEGVRRARVLLAREGASPLSFARYVLYGEPRTVLAQEVAVLPMRGSTRSDPTLPVSAAFSDGIPVSSARGPARGEEPLRPDPAAAARGRNRTLFFALSGMAALGAAAWIANAVFFGSVTADGDRVAAAPDVAPKAVDEARAEPSALGSPDARTGNVRMAVLDLQPVGGETDPHMTSRLRSTLNFALVGADGIEVTDRPDFEQFAAELERGATMRIFDQPAFDEVRRAQVGHLRGVEVAIVGGFQQAGDRLRITANFVDVETGVVIEAVRLDGPAGEAHLFDLQDELAARILAALPKVRERLRP
jgi:class 3 adenylate cyclase